MDYIKTRGWLKYDPNRHELKKVYKSRTLIAELQRDDLDLYYQWHLRKKYGSWFDHEIRRQAILNENQTSTATIDENIPRVQRPMWGKHVTIVRGDELGYKSKNWGKYQGQEIEIFYSPELEVNWKFWSLPVKGDNLFGLRQELGLKAFHNFHITIAREI